MYDFENEREIVGYAYDTNGIATHAASIIPDPEPMILMEGLAAQFRDEGLRANIRIVREPFLAHLNAEYYELERRTRLDEAWERLSEEFDPNDAVEMFTRYANIFHPRTVIHHVNLSTGCSQGDWVELIMWLEADVIDNQWTHYQARDMPLNVRRARAIEQAYNCLKAHCEEFEQAATGEAYGIALHELDISVSYDGDPVDGSNDHTISFELGSPEDECWGYIGHDHAVESAKDLLPK